MGPKHGNYPPLEEQLASSSGGNIFRRPTERSGALMGVVRGRVLLISIRQGGVGALRAPPCPGPCASAAPRLATPHRPERAVRRSYYRR